MTAGVMPGYFGKLATPLAALVLVIGCTPSTAVAPPAPPTEEAARAHLRAVVAVVESGDLGLLCALGSGTCEMELRNADPALRPADPPILVGSEAILPTPRGDGAWDLGGRLLQLIGCNGADEPYFAEMLVFESGGRLISNNTLYWLGGRVARSSTVGGEPPLAPPPAPPCPQ
jgi:hypothetical protein